MKKTIAFSLFGAGALLFFLGIIFNLPDLKLASKAIPLTVLIVLLPFEHKFQKLITFGLIFSLAGDILLELPYNLFVYGLLAFLVAQVFYIFAFTHRSKSIEWPAALLALALGVVLFYFLYPGLNKMLIPVLAYMLVILTMGWRAYAQRNYDKFAILAFIGALLFILSDSLIAFNKFYEPIEHSRWMIMSTYWSAQILIFYSALKTKE